MRVFLMDCSFPFTVSLTVSLTELSMVVFSLTLTLRLLRSLPWDALCFGAANCFGRKSIIVSFLDDSFSKQKFLKILISEIDVKELSLGCPAGEFARYNLTLQWSPVLTAVFYREVKFFKCSHSITVSYRFQLCVCRYLSLVRHEVAFPQ